MLETEPIEFTNRVISLAHKANEKITEYFKGEELDSQHTQMLLQSHIESLEMEPTSSVLIPVRLLASLQFYLSEILQKITKTFTHNNIEGNEYKFLRNVWNAHRERMLYREEVDEKIDGINQVVSMLKMRMRNLTHQTHLKMLSQSSEQDPLEMQHGSLLQHPILQKIQQKYCRQSQQLQQKTQRLQEQIQKSENLNEANKKVEKKLQTLKQKIKKSDKTIFELTKQKVGLEKKIFEYERNSDQTFIPLNKQNRQGNMIRSVKVSHDESDRFFKRRFDDTESKCQDKAPLTQRITNLEEEVTKQMANKFKNIRRFRDNRQKTALNNSLNSSTDSLKTLRFERTNSKKNILSKMPQQHSVMLLKNASTTSIDY